MSLSRATAVPPQRDSREIRRALAQFIGWGYIAYFVIVATEIPGEAATVPGWWTAAALITVFVPGWAMLAASYRRAQRITTVIMPVCCGMGYLLAIVSWFAVWTGAHTESSTGTWLVTFPGLAALTLVVTPRPWLALVHLAIALPAVQVANSWARSEQYGQLLVTDIAWGIAFSALFVLAGMMAVRTGDQLDRSYASTLELAEEAAAQREREVQRKLYGRMIHDSILAVMSEAPRANDDPTVGRDARETLRDWAGQEDAGSSKQPIGTGDVWERIRAAASRAHSDAVVTRESSGDSAHPQVVPLRVGVALADATAEAVRNARRHAGQAATVTVCARLDSQPLVVRIVDDGPGFDPAIVAPKKLGITRSIVERMSDVGGDACVDTRPGGGTRIELRWPR
ncbi:MAG: ATP-binding protein [Actinomycetota bacterium]